MNDLDKWLVLAPGRTGSTLVSFYIVYKDPDHPLEFYRQHITGREANFKFAEKGYVWHSHSLQALDVMEPGTRLIITTRTISEIAISFEIAKVTEVWNLNQRATGIANSVRTRKLKNVTPFRVPPLKFIKECERVRGWYASCRKILKERNIPYTVIQYEDIAEDNKKIYELLNLPCDHNHAEFTIKLPYDKEQIVTNIEDLYKLIDHNNNSGYNILTNYE